MTTSTDKIRITQLPGSAKKVMLHVPGVSADGERRDARVTLAPDDYTDLLRAALQLRDVPGLVVQTDPIVLVVRSAYPDFTPTGEQTTEAYHMAWRCSGSAETMAAAVGLLETDIQTFNNPALFEVKLDLLPEIRFDVPQLPEAPEFASLIGQVRLTWWDRFKDDIGDDYFDSLRAQDVRHMHRAAASSNALSERELAELADWAAELEDAVDG